MTIDNTKIDFDYSINQIKQELDTNNIYLQEDILDSELINKTFENFEYRLNKLYENTRYLEDAINYCEAFLNLKIKDYSQQIIDINKAIEDASEINRNSSYIEYLIAFKDDLSQKKDRDNSNISTMAINNNYLYLNNAKEQTITYKDISKKSNYVPYKTNFDNTQNISYKSYYIEEKIAEKGVSETITITLETPTKINYLDLKAINADIKNVKLIYLNGIEEQIDYESCVIPEVIVAQIKFDIICKSYKNTSYYIDKDKLTTDVWNKMKEYEFYITNELQSKIEMEEAIARVNGEDIDIFNNDIINSPNIIEKKMYSYIFGLSTIDIKYIEQQNESCFISESINIGQLDENHYIQLFVDHLLSDSTGIEYYLLDGDMEIPMLPYGTTIIKNEKLFPALSLRFHQDETEAHTIKKDGMTTDISIDDAKNQMLSTFSIDYFPAQEYNYTPINPNIRIKVIVRKFGKGVDNSFIRSLKFRKYGGDSPWISS